VHQINEIIHDAVGDDAEIIFGAVHEPAMQGEIRVTVIATGFDSARAGTIAQVQKSPPVLPFPTQRQPPMPRASRPAITDIPRRASDLRTSDQDLSDMEIPTFIRRQMD
jgi:cell division protein FtsZ